MPRSTLPYNNVDITSFNSKKFFNPEKNLHWKSMSSTGTLYTVEKFVEQFADLHDNYRKSPLFTKTVNYFSNYTKSELEEFQSKYLDLINHDQFASIFPAFIEDKEANFLKVEIDKIYKAATLFARDLAIGSGQATQFSKYIRAKYPNDLCSFETVLSTSLYNYSYHHQDSRFSERAKDPLYSECGVDIMLFSDKSIFAELQFSYQSYPQHIDILSAGLKKLFPDLMADISEDTFNSSRVEIIDKYIASVGNENNISRYVIDAWAATKHPSRNYKILAHGINAQYLLFDDFHEDKLSYKEYISAKGQSFIFNQPLLYLLDRQGLFGSILHERLEEYPYLNLSGIYDDYMNKKTFLANPPIIDILNDKAIYRFIPQMVEFYLNEKCNIPISMPSEVWSKEDYLSANKACIAELLKNKDHYVICHRYLEAGDGIRIGKMISEEDWETFINNYVVEKPYLFITREYITLSPDISLRSYCSGIFDNNTQETIVSDTMLGRINLTSATSTSSHFFLCFPDNNSNNNYCFHNHK